MQTDRIASSFPRNIEGAGAIGTFVRRAGGKPALVLAIFAYLPNIFSNFAQMSWDNKFYLYQDPLRFLRAVPNVWWDQVSMGGVTHQYVGYLLPLGPYYALTIGILHLPAWLAQRIYTGTLLYLAGLGATYLGRVLGLGEQAPLIAGLSYMLSPYPLQYLYRISAILNPWAALPWLDAFVALAVTGPWLKYGSLFSLTVLLIGGINGSSLVYAGLSPLLMVAWLVVTRRASWRRAVFVTGGLAVMSCALSAWWVVPYFIESRYGLDVLHYTETLPAVASTSLASEVLRGLGYWFYYGNNPAGNWAASAPGYMEHPWLILVSFLLPGLGLAGLVGRRVPARGFLVAQAAVGLTLAVGSHPFDHPAPLGAVLKAFMSRTTFGFALRSTDRATPLVCLSLAIGVSLAPQGLASLLTRLRIRASKVVRLAPLMVALLVVLDNPTVFNGQVLNPQYEYPETLPVYYQQAARFLERLPHPGRILVVPGDDTATYRWGNTVDDPWPGLTPAQVVLREQLPTGEPASVDLMIAFDDQFQNDTLDPRTIAPIASLEGASSVLLQSDLAYELYDLPDPRVVAALVRGAPGLRRQASFGPSSPNLPPKKAKVVLGEQVLPEYAKLPWPPKLTLYSVPHPRPLFRVEGLDQALVVDGGGSGLVLAAGQGLVHPGQAVFYAPSLSGDHAFLARLVRNGATLLVTDTNPKAPRRWGGTVLEVQGAVETPGSHLAANDPGAAPLPVFEHEPAGSQTTAFYLGVKDVVSSVYGNQVSYEAFHQPYFALDGDPDTYWGFSTLGYDAKGQWWQVTFQTPVVADRIRISQVLTDSPRRYITEATATFDGGSPVTFRLGPSSLTPRGQVIRFPERRFQTLRLTIDAVAPTGARTGTEDVGLSEVEVGGIKAIKGLALPTDLLSALGPLAGSAPLAILVHREATGPALQQAQPEDYMLRRIYLPSARSFSVSGDATLDPSAPEPYLDSLLNLSPPGYVPLSSGSTPGYLAASAWAAFDGDPTTAWSPGSGLQAQLGATVGIDLPQAVTFSNMTIAVIDDDRHSLPRRAYVSTESGLRTVTLPNLPPGPPDTVRRFSVSFPPLTGRQVRVTVASVWPRYARGAENTPYFALPVALSEIGVPGIPRVQPHPVPPPGCISGLISVNGTPVLPGNPLRGTDVPIRITSVYQDALGQVHLRFVGCDGASVFLGPGENLLETAPGSHTGIQIDRLLLSSPAPATTTPHAVAPLPPFRLVRWGDTAKVGVVEGPCSPCLVVLGDSFSRGWSVRVEGPGRLGRHLLVDGFANGWVLYSTGPVRLTFEFWPQRLVYAGYAVSGVAALVLALALAARLRRRGPKERLPEGSGPRLTSRSAAMAAVALPVLFLAASGGLVAGAACAALVGLLAACAGRYFVCLLRLTSSLVAACSMPALGVVLCVRQVAFRLPPNAAWPSSFEPSHVVGLIAVAALLSASLLAVARPRGEGLPGP